MQGLKDGLKALTNCTVYLGAGKSISRAYVVFDRERTEEVGPLGSFKPGPGMETFDLQGALVLPGLIDSHLHLVNYAKSLVEIDLADTRSLEAGLDVVGREARHLPAGAWLRGRGWDKQRWGLDSFPTRTMLDSVAPDRPVALTSRDGHLLWLNSAALSALGLDRPPEPVEGGEAVVDARGRPTGMFKEKAATLILGRLDSRDRGRAQEAIALACGNLRRLGLTGVHTIEPEGLSRVLDEAVDAGLVPLDLFRMQEVLTAEEIDSLSPSSRIACIKTYADGTLGSQTASMLEPFNGQPGNFGIPFAAKAELRRIVLRAVGRGFAVSVHAIGDRATRDVLDIYEEVRTEEAREAAERVSRGGRTEGGGGLTRRALLRIEHAQILSPGDVSRFGCLGVVASMQPIHLVSDRPVADRYWGARSQYAYAWKRIMDAGGTVAFGSDAPIESPDPLKGIHAAVTRSDPLRPDLGPWYPDERLAVWQAIDCFSFGGIAASGGEPGDLVGGRPSFSILDTNIVEAEDPGMILTAHVIGTVVGGQPFFYL